VALSTVVTAVLAIAVVLLAAGLLYALLARRSEPAEQPDLEPAIQAATSRAIDDLLKVSEESRKRDSEAAKASREREAEAARESLDRRQAEIKALAEKIGGVRPICRPAPCSNRWGRRSAASTRRPPA
jgi:uncharacterized protein HemX